MPKMLLYYANPVRPSPARPHSGMLAYAAWRSGEEVETGTPPDGADPFNLFVRIKCKMFSIVIDKVLPANQAHRPHSRRAQLCIHT